MNLALWIVPGLLAVVALVGGISKAFVPKEKLAGTSGDGSNTPASTSSGPWGSANSSPRPA